jgi:hypothetical protein
MHHAALAHAALGAGTPLRGREGHRSLVAPAAISATPFGTPGLEHSRRQP